MHALVLLGLVIWKIVNTDWVFDIPWIDYVTSREFIWSISVPNAPMWDPPQWVYDRSDARYLEWYRSESNPLFMTSGASHSTGEGVLKVCWAKVILKVAFLYAMFLFCEKLIFKKRRA